MGARAPISFLLVLFLLRSTAAIAQSRPTTQPSTSDPCHGRGSSILIRTEAHRLHLCQEGATVDSYRVALGKGGIDKRKRGDNRTPLGSYPLGDARASGRFGTFIPVGYPTAQQRAAGYTGSDIGIHGPDRRFTWLGRLGALVDWTQGCVAVGSDAEIVAIVIWVRQARAKVIHIE